ncbi:hypothetical protein [Henriciella marina]|nr:hypothetical protein [Henriciella marina]
MPGRTYGAAIAEFPHVRKGLAVSPKKWPVFGKEDGPPNTERLE